MAVPTAGGAAETGLGDKEEEAEDEDEAPGHSRVFMSWRLRQKLVTCSVL